MGIVVGGSMYDGSHYKIGGRDLVMESVNSFFCMFLG